MLSLIFCRRLSPAVFAIVGYAQQVGGPDISGVAAAGDVLAGWLTSS
jgi:hypothetical protein